LRERSLKAKIYVGIISLNARRAGSSPSSSPLPVDPAVGLDGNGRAPAPVVAAPSRELLRRGYRHIFAVTVGPDGRGVHQDVETAFLELDCTILVLMPGQWGMVMTSLERVLEPNSTETPECIRPHTIVEGAEIRDYKCDCGHQMRLAAWRD
jgi:hypothetical protein